MALIANAYKEFQKALDASLQVDAIRAQKPEVVNAVRNLLDMIGAQPKADQKAMIDEVQEWLNYSKKEWDNLTTDLHASTTQALSIHSKNLKQTSIFSLIDEAKLAEFTKLKAETEARAKADKAMKETKKTSEGAPAQPTLFDGKEADASKGASGSDSKKTVLTTDKPVTGTVSVNSGAEGPAGDTAYDKTVAKAKTAPKSTDELPGSPPPIPKTKGTVTQLKSAVPG